MYNERSRNASSNFSLETSKYRNQKNKQSLRTTEKKVDISESTSHTQYYRECRNTHEMKQITKKEYISVISSSSNSSETFKCIHGPEGRHYSDAEKLNKFLKERIDPIHIDPHWQVTCPAASSLEIIETLKFMVNDPTACQQEERLLSNIQELANLTISGYKVDYLAALQEILDFLVENLMKIPNLKGGFEALLHNLAKPFILQVSSDIVKNFENLYKFILFLGYLLMRLEEDEHFALVSKALIWHLSAPDSQRGQDTVRLGPSLAAASILCNIVTRMLTISPTHRFATFLEIALLLACDNADNCVEMMKDNIIETIFYRFNPYFPDRELPSYDINPADPQDYKVKLGASSKYLSCTLSLLMVLLKTAQELLAQNVEFKKLLHCPDQYSQRCFTWAFRYECKAREHNHERTTLTIILSLLLHCFGPELRTLSDVLLPDILSLSVATELPTRKDWIGTVHFNTSQNHVHFKIALMHSSVNFINTFPLNRYIMQHRYWFVGLMYLLDPGLCKLRVKWSSSLFAELRKTALKSLVCTLHLVSPETLKGYDFLKRLMWYIEWYIENPYELPILYWCLRVLHVLTYNRNSSGRQIFLKDLFESHGIIIIIRLCFALMKQKTPPVEKGQVILSVCLRFLSNAVEANEYLSCCVYPEITWPSSVNTLAAEMLDVVLISLEKHFILSDRWVISLLDFIWEAIIWNDEYRKVFLTENGVYKLLDIIAMSRESVQCIALALICDAARAGEGVAQLLTWRAGPSSSTAHPNLVRKGATIGNLLAALSRNECLKKGVELNSCGVIQILENPLKSTKLREELYNLECSQNQRNDAYDSITDMAGSLISKSYALLHMLSKDLAFKVSIADEAYNLYKNIKLSPHDEAILVLCSHFLTIKLNETWTTTRILNPILLPQDNSILDDFITIIKGWGKEIKQEQEDVIEKRRKEEHDEERSLYEFLSKVRLNRALDALREVRCIVQSATHLQKSYYLLHDVLSTHLRRPGTRTNPETPLLNTNVLKTNTKGAAETR